MNIYEIINRYDDFINNSRLNSLIQILNNNTMIIENCGNISVFNENEIKLELVKCTVSVVGLELKMRNYNRTGVEIKGKFHSINFDEKG